MKLQHTFIKFEILNPRFSGPTWKLFCEQLRCEATAQYLVSLCELIKICKHNMVFISTLMMYNSAGFVITLLVGKKKIVPCNLNMQNNVM